MKKKRKVIKAKTLSKPQKKVTIKIETAVSKPKRKKKKILKRNIA